MKTTSAAILFILCGLVAIGFSNCSQFTASSVDFSSNSVTSSPLLASEPPDGPPNLVLGPPFTSPVDTLCSDLGTANLDGNIIESTTSLTLTLTNTVSGANCTYSDPSIRLNLINTQTFTIPALKQICPLLGPGNYAISLIGNGDSMNLMAGTTDPLAIRLGGAAPYVITVTTDSNGNLVMAPAASMAGIEPTVLMGHNQTGNDITVGTGTMNNLCDQRASPLIVQLHPGSSAVQQIMLSSPGAGVLFDILGHRATPAPFTKQFISWFTPETVQGNYFIVLPDATGAVSGIDQMFGNNTYGPDGTYAANGYAALGKYDANQDGKITAADPVFSQLRLWMDSNGDGIAQPFELYTLEQMQVVSISLNYDSNYGQTDTYGNQVKYRSVVQTSDGLLHIMYDIWFKYYQ
jgi:hypothetical protein